MKGIGMILVLLGLAFGGYFVIRDLEAITGKRDGRTVIEPMAAAQETAGKVQDSLNNLQKQLDGLDK